MLKKISIFFLCIIITILISLPAIASPTVILDGKELSFDVAPTIENGRTLVPLRVIFEALEAEVTWNEDTQTVLATKDNLNLSLIIGQSYATVGKETRPLDVPAKVINGRTLVPLRFVSESLGLEVNWQESNQSITLISPKAPNNINLQPATITKIVDGDTLTVLIDGKEYKIRLILVNTPESVHPNQERNNEYGKISSIYTSSQLPIGSIVYLQKDVSETDKYGRLLRYVWLEKPTNLDSENEIRNKMYNAQLLLEGYAEVSTYPPDIKYINLFEKFVQEARNSEKGLWGYQEINENEIQKDSISKLDNNDQNIYRTKTGEKYHLENCSALSKSKIEITLEEAKQIGLKPCEKCNPPT